MNLLISPLYIIFKRKLIKLLELFFAILQLLIRKPPFVVFIHISCGKRRSRQQNKVLICFIWLFMLNKLILKSHISVFYFTYFTFWPPSPIPPMSHPLPLATTDLLSVSTRAFVPPLEQQREPWVQSGRLQKKKKSPKMFIRVSFGTTSQHAVLYIPATYL